MHEWRPARIAGGIVQRGGELALRKRRDRPSFAQVVLGMHEVRARRRERGLGPDRLLERVQRGLIVFQHPARQSEAVPDFPPRAPIAIACSRCLRASPGRPASSKLLLRDRPAYAGIVRDEARRDLASSVHASRRPRRDALSAWPSAAAATLTRIARMPLEAAAAHDSAPLNGVAASGMGARARVSQMLRGAGSD